MHNRILDFYTVNNTKNELEKISNIFLVNKLDEIIKNCEIEKPLKHNKPEEIETSKFKINLSDEEIIEIIDIFSDLEVSSLNENYEATNSTNFYVDILDKWNNLLANEIDFIPGMKVKLNDEYGIVTEEKIENNFGIILWDTEKNEDLENWCGQFGSFKDCGGIIVDKNYKFRFI